MRSLLKKNKTKAERSLGKRVMLIGVSECAGRL
jgi:hypothetical protein